MGRHRRNRQKLRHKLEDRIGEEQFADIVQSATQGELKHPAMVANSPQRIRRIARGCGYSPADVRLAFKALASAYHGKATGFTEQRFRDMKREFSEEEREEFARRKRHAEWDKRWHEDEEGRHHRVEERLAVALAKEGPFNDLVNEALALDMEDEERIEYLYELLEEDGRENMAVGVLYFGYGPEFEAAQERELTFEEACEMIDTFDAEAKADMIQWGIIVCLNRERGKKAIQQRREEGQEDPDIVGRHLMRMRNGKPERGEVIAQTATEILVKFEGAEEAELFTADSVIAEIGARD
jgi:hypothetical protein